MVLGWIGNLKFRGGSKLAPKATPLQVVVVASQNCIVLTASQNSVSLTASQNQVVLL